MVAKGVSLVEVIIAMFILSVTALMMADVFMTGGRISVRNEEVTIATGLARELIEEVKAKPFGAAIVLSPLPLGFEKFTRSVKAEFVKKENFNKTSPVDTDFIKVTATVSSPNIQAVVFTTVTNKAMSPAEE